LHLLFLLPGILSFYGVTGQGFPKEMTLSPNGRMLLTGSETSDELYHPDTVRTIELTFPQTNYWTLLTQNYASKTDIPAAMVVDGVTYDSVGVRFKGQTSYSMVQGQKKSFNISLDYVHNNQDIDGYQTLNLNNCFQDASFMREFYYFSHAKRHNPATKVAYSWLKINGQDWGLYPSVQQINKDYLKEWFLSNNGTNWRADAPAGTGGGGGGGGPQWGDGTAALNYLGNDTSLFQPYYTLKSNTKLQPWSDLVTTTQALANVTAANYATTLAPVLDIDRALWHLATETAYSDDDSYIHKGKMDYYTYYEIETNRMTPLEYDGNSVMKANAVNWSPFYNETKPNYPLMNKLYAIPELRQRYIAHLRTIIKEQFDATASDAFINKYQAMIDSLVNADPKKLYTYANFGTEINALKTFISGRRTNLLNNAEVAQPVPVVSGVFYTVNGTQWAQVQAPDSVWVNATATFITGIYAMNLYYAAGIVGNFTKTSMYDDGLHQDGAANDGVFGGKIPAQQGASWVRFYIETVANNPAKSVVFVPEGAEHDVFVYYVKPLAASAKNIAINEVMAKNTTTAADDSLEYDDWVELYNLTTQDIDLTGYTLSDDSLNYTKWRFTSGTILPASGYLIVWADEDAGQGDLHANFKLSGDGESLYLMNPSYQMVDQVHFGAQVTDMGYARVPNGTGNFVVQSPTFSANNNATGIDEAVFEGKIQIYPNPGNDKVQVLMSGKYDENVELYDISGGLIGKYPASERFTIHTGGFASGIYLLRSGNLHQKLIVQH
ncbi:MAG: CotH kinase family protein, partial [Bacteroidia bacterium]|nr:CotH kinase family protein [Bacteroidia bacterium]